MTHLHENYIKNKVYNMKKVNNIKLYAYLLFLGFLKYCFDITTDL